MLGLSRAQPKTFQGETVDADHWRKSIAGLTNKLSWLREGTMYGMVLEGTTIQYINPLGPAYLHDLRQGDNIVAVNGEQQLSYHASDFFPT